MENQETGLVQIAPQQLDQMKSVQKQLINFVSSQLRPELDYGVIPGTDKRSLLKPGAEKINFLFQLKPEMRIISKTEDFNNGFFFYTVEVTLIHFPSGKEAGQAIRSCNSMEKKYAYVTVGEKFATEAQKKAAVETFQSAKGYTMLRVKKSAYEMADQANTILAMAQKRALVAATVHATMATEIFDGSGDDPEDDVAPNAPVTVQEDPQRVTAMRALFAAASDRGFESKKFEQQIEKKFGVDSIKKVSTTQLRQAYDYLVTNYAIGDKPTKMGVVDTATALPAEVENTALDAVVIESGPRYCRNVAYHNGDQQVPVPEDSPYEWICSEECYKDYFKEADKPRGGRR